MEKCWHMSWKMGIWNRKGWRKAKRWIRGYLKREWSEWNDVKGWQVGVRRGGRLCVWHESVCLGHTRSGLFSPFLCLGDADRERRSLSEFSIHSDLHLYTVLSYPLVQEETLEDSETGRQSRHRGGETKRLREGNWQKVRLREIRAEEEGGNNSLLEERVMRSSHYCDKPKIKDLSRANC